MSVVKSPVAGILINKTSSPASTDNADTLNGSVGDDTIYGFSGNDVIRGFASGSMNDDGDDIIYGGDGNDSIYGGTGYDSIDGGNGSSDRVYYYSVGAGSTATSVIDHITVKSQFNLNLAARLEVNKSAVAGYLYDPGIDYLSNIETVYGSFNADTFDLADPRIRNVYISGMGGSDKISQTPFGTSPFDPTYTVNYRTNGITATYWWVAPRTGSTEGIQLKFISGTTAEVKYFDNNTTYATSGIVNQRAGTDTLTYVSSVEDSYNDDLLDFSSFKIGYQGYASRARDGSGVAGVLLKGGSDTVIGNGNLGIYFTNAGTQASGKSGGFTIDLKLGLADLSNVSGYGTLKFSGVEGVNGSAFADKLTGGQVSQDDFEFFRGEAGNDTIDGGSGYDRAVYSTAAESISVNLGTGIVTGGTTVGTDTLLNIESVLGTDYADTFDARTFATLSSNDFMPGGGDDIVYGNGWTRVSYENSLVAVRADVSSGADALNAADKTGSDYTLSLGKDTYNGGINRLDGSQFGDYLIGSAVGDGNLGSEIFQGWGGNDTIDAGAGWDWSSYWSSPYAITVDMTKSSNQIQDGWGNTDTLIGVEAVDGSAFADRMRGSDSATLLEGFSGRMGADSIDGGAGLNKATYIWDIGSVVVWLAAKGAASAPAAALTDVLQTGYSGVAKDGWGNVDQLVNIQGAEGSAYDDTLIGNELTNRFDGRSGNDSVDGGAGFDWAEYNNSPASVNVDLSTLGASNDGWGGNDRLVGIEALLGSMFADSLAGDTAANQIDGLDGNDAMSGADGNDTLNGGLGNDSLDGGSGDDVMAGNDGDDMIRAGAGRDYLLGGAGNDSMALSTSGTWSSSYRAQSDFLAAASVQSTQNKYVPLNGMNRFEAVSNGGDGADAVALTSGNDALFVDDVFSQLNSQASLDAGRLISIESIDAGLGDDLVDLTTLKFSLAGFSVLGGGGNDTLWGGQGADTLSGGDGSDVLLGGAGNDTLTGGAGSDVFLFASNSGQDSISDFVTGDKVRLLGGTGSGAVVTQTANDTVLTWGGIQVTLAGVKLATTDTSWFEYVA